MFSSARRDRGRGKVALSPTGARKDETDSLISPDQVVAQLSAFWTVRFWGFLEVVWDAKSWH